VRVRVRVVVVGDRVRVGVVVDRVRVRVRVVVGDRVRKKSIEEEE
jgi:hypothetical protein